MKQTRLPISAFLCFIIYTLGAQTNLEIARDAELAFPKADIALASSEVRVTFKTIKKDKLVAVVEHTDKYVSLDNNTRASFAIFYDEYSEVKSFNSGFSKQDEYYTSNEIFHSDTRVTYSELRFGKYGDMHTATATKQYNDMRYLTNFYITRSKPSLKRVISIEIPDNMEIDLLPFYLEDHEVKYTKIKSKKGYIHTYTANNVDAYDNSPGLPGHSYIYPHVLVLPKSYEKNGKKIALFRDTKDQYGWYKSLVDKIGNDNQDLKATVAKLTEGASSDIEKMENLFYWVQDNIRYIAFEDGIAGFKPESCQNVYNKRFGDCKGMANLLKEMLLIAGYDARLCWIGTKSVVYNYEIPSLLVDNHMICAVKQGDDFIFLDGTEKFININNYAERIQGQEALIEDGDNFILKTVPQANALDNKLTLSLDLSMEETVLAGKVEASFMGEAKSSIRNAISNTKQNKIEEAAVEYLKYGNENVSVKEVALKDFDQKSKQSTIKGDIKLLEFVSTFGKETYVYVDPFKIYDNHDLKSDRKFEYWFNHKVNDIVNVKLKLNKAQKISSVPDQLSISNPEFEIQGKYTVTDDVVDYQFSIQIPQAKISKSNISSWNEAVKQMKDFYEQPIILEKQ